MPEPERPSAVREDALEQVCSLYRLYLLPSRFSAQYTHQQDPLVSQAKASIKNDMSAESGIGCAFDLFDLA